MKKGVFIGSIIAAFRPEIALLLLLLLSAGMPARAETPEGEVLLEAEQTQGDLPFSRAIGVGGIVEHSFADSAIAAGVPPAVLLEASQALAVAIDLGREVHPGDRFYIRYEQNFTLAGAPTKAGWVLWAEITQPNRRTVGVHRFRPRNGLEQLWTDNGLGTGSAQLRMPLDRITVSSGFGLRVDPFDQPGTGGYSRTMTGFAARSRSGPYAMHEGVDLVAHAGTPIHAAGDGVVLGAEPKGRYGNWVEIEHKGGFATVYGHLSAFGSGIAPGAAVRQGDVIGFVGTTGRTTGPHVHFELLVNGRPVNPISNLVLRHSRLLGPELGAYRKAVAADRAEREREEKTWPSNR